MPVIAGDPVPFSSLPNMILILLCRLFRHPSGGPPSVRWPVRRPSAGGVQTPVDDQPFPVVVAQAERPVASSDLRKLELSAPVPGESSEIRKAGKFLDVQEAFILKQGKERTPLLDICCKRKSTREPALAGRRNWQGIMPRPSGARCLGDGFIHAQSPKGSCEGGVPSVATSGAGLPIGAQPRG